MSAEPFDKPRTAPVEAPRSTTAGRMESASGKAAFQVVDWKTGRAELADPLQLAIYRLAWAEAHGLAVGEIDAIFYYVRTDEIVRPTALPDRQAIESILNAQDQQLR